MRAAAWSQTKAWVGRIGFGSAISAAAALTAGAALRFWMVAEFFETNGDPLIYGGLAKTILNGWYATPNNSGILETTLIRLPGYPLFLAACFRIFGVDRYFPPIVVQIFCELAGCLVLAWVAAHICAKSNPASNPAPHRKAAFHATLWLACLCPFTAIYAASALTESLTCLTITVALAAVLWFEEKQTWPAAICFTLAITYAALLRPDGALIAISFAAPMLLALFPSLRTTASRVPHSWRVFLRQGWDRIRMALVCLLIAITPFAAWTIRNWRVFHVFQPLAPRYATDPGEPTWPGWQRWVKTWSLDFYTTYEVYWNVPDAPLDLTQLPARAFDSPAQRAETEALVRAYEANGENLSPSIDAGFAKLAAARIAARPLRYYVVLPLGRVLDMLFRPRVENLPIDLDWWVYRNHYLDTEFSWFYAGLNLFYFLLAAIGLCLRPHLWKWMLLYFVLRSALLSTLEAPEARYTIEFFPLVFILAGIAIARLIPRSAKAVSS